MTTRTPADQLATLKAKVQVLTRAEGLGLNPEAAHRLHRSELRQASTAPRGQRFRS